MKNLIVLIMFMFTMINLISAQTVGTPNGNTSFFNTNAQGKLLGHRQSGAFGSFGVSAKWIGIGQPVPTAYGMRIQANGNSGILALTGTGNNKKLELNWGGVGKTADFDINHIFNPNIPTGKTKVFTIARTGAITAKSSIKSLSRLFLFGNIQSLSGDNNATLYYRSNNNTTTSLVFRDKDNTKYGQIYGGGNGANFGLLDGDGHWAFLMSKDRYTSFRINNSEKMRIISNGNIGIGTHAPTNKLHVAAPARINNMWIGGYPSGGGFTDGIAGLYSLHLNAAKTNNIGGNIVFSSSGTQKMIMNRNGYLGVLRNPSYALDVNGSARVTSLFQSSDKRLKKDIKRIDGALGDIINLDGFSYQFKNDKIGQYDFLREKDKNQLGFIAQDFRKIFPELVSEDDDGYLSINYIGLIPVIVEAFKEQQQIIDDQVNGIADLHSRLKNLESLIDAPSDVSQGSIKEENYEKSSGVVLRQNIPNPFSNNTRIEYQLPNNILSGSLVVSDLTGKTIRSYEISGKGEVQLYSEGLNAGMYIFSLIGNGKIIASRKMIIQK